MDRFAQLLFDLGREIGIELHPDRNHFCKLNYQGKLHVQLEFQESKEQLLVASFLCEVPPGRYRENLFKEALKTNDERDRMGILAYSARNNQLVLFDFLYAPHLTGPKLMHFLDRFLKKALEWKEAVERGLPLPSPHTPPSGGAPFGLRP